MSRFEVYIFVYLHVEAHGKHLLWSLATVLTAVSKCAKRLKRSSRVFFTTNSPRIFVDGLSEILLWRRGCPVWVVVRLLAPLLFMEQFAGVSVLVLQGLTESECVQCTQVCIHFLGTILTNFRLRIQISGF